MFLIHGEKRSRLKSFAHGFDRCKHCGHYALRVDVYRRYFHLYWIPVFPYGSKWAEVICENCGTADLNEAIPAQYLAVTRTPFYLFSGSGLIAGLIVAFIFMVQESNKEEELVCDNPMVGDVIKMKEQDVSGKKSYYYLKIIRLSPESLFFYRNSKNYEKLISVFDKDDYYLTAETAMTRNQFRDLFASRKLISVNPGPLH